MVGFFVSRRFALILSLILLVAAAVLVLTGSLGWAAGVGYVGLLLLVLVWNHCAALARPRDPGEKDV